jgi:hypothetical protein
MRKLYAIIILGLFTLACNKPKVLPEATTKIALPVIEMISPDLPDTIKPASAIMHKAMSDIDFRPVAARMENVEFTAVSPKSITITIPKKEVIDSFTQVKYAQIGVLAIYDKIMNIGKDYSVTVKVFRGTLTENSNSNTITMFTDMSAKTVGILLESDAFIIKSKTNTLQTLLPENSANVWSFLVTPVKTGEQILNVKFGTSDTDNLSFKKPDSKQVKVVASIGFIRAKAILFREHYLRNQILYNSLGGIIVFLSGFILVKKKRKS